MTSRSRAATAALLACGALGLAGTQILPASAMTPEPASAPLALPHVAASGPATTVTLFLKAPDAAALEALAAQPVGDRTARLAALAPLLPSDANRDTVARLLSADGFTVGARSTWSVTATAPSSVITGLFGTRPGMSAGRAAATGALPLLPAALRPLVGAVFPTTGGPAAFRPLATSTLTGTDFRNADTAATVAPSTGMKSGGVTVATLQLANFASSDLTTYASDNSLPDPIAAKTFKQISVDGGPSVVTDAESEEEGSIEVGLDQESILSTAPSAHQAAYFAPNTDAGFDDVFSNVLDDVLGNSMATAPDPHLVAMSSSWGGCESGYGAAAITTLEPILASVAAAGVSIFASSGDDGIYDCRSPSGTGADNSQADVDFPASSPFVVSTGGSNLSATASAPNSGSNWTESTWSCATATACQNSQTGTGGGGGGASGSASTADGGTGDFTGFVQPAWQRATLTGDYAGQQTRLVPDIAADADPTTGFDVYTTLNTGVQLAGQTLTVGGTSLASPISAAQLANTLADAGRTTGVGDIHPALYSAYADTAADTVTDPARAFRDITVGQIGADADRGADPSTHAVVGYDTASGLGGVLWNALAPYLVSTATPTVTASATAGTASDPSATTVPLTFSWTSATDKDPILLDTTAVTVSQTAPAPAGGAPTTTTVYSVVTPTTPATAAMGAAATPGTTTIDGVPGDTYLLTVTGTDLAGHQGVGTAPLSVASTTPPTSTPTGTPTGSPTGTPTGTPTSPTGTPTTTTIDPVGTPSITGSKRVGVRITGHPGTWDSAATLSYQWLRNGVVVPGATRTTYLLGAADRGTQMSLSVTATKPGASDASRTSAPTSAVAYGIQMRQPKPTLGGRATVGRQLKVHPGAHDAGVALHYVWYVGTHRTGVTSQTFRVVKADRGQKITAVATATEPGYRSVVKQTRTTRPVR